MKEYNTEEREIRFLGEIQRLCPKEDDIFVLTCDRLLSKDQRDFIINTWKNISSNKLIVLDGGMRLSIIGKEDVERKEPRST